MNESVRRTGWVIGGVFLSGALAAGLLHCVADDSIAILITQDSGAQADTGGNPPTDGSRDGNVTDDGGVTDGSVADAVVDAPPVPDGSFVSRLTFGTNTGSPAGSQRVAFDKQGNYFVSFAFNQPTTIGTFSITNASGGSDLGVAKVSPSGTVLWARQYGSTGFDSPGGIAVDDNGDVYISGSFEIGTGSISFGAVTVANTSQRYGSFVAKLAGSNGDGLRAVNFARTFQGGACTSLSYRAGKLAVGCSIEGTIGMTGVDGGAITLAFPQAAGFNGVVALLDPNTLNAIWANPIFSPGSDSVRSVSISPNGDVLVAASFSGLANVKDSAGTMDLPGVSAGQNALVVRLAAATGGAKWAKVYDGALSVEGAVVDGQDAAWFAGSVTGSVSVGSGKTLTSVGQNDVAVFKLDTTGGTTLARTFGGASLDSASAIAVDPFGSAYVVGQYRSVGLGFDGKFLPDPIGTSTSAFMVKLDPNIVAVWAKGFTTATATTATQAWHVALNPVTLGAAFSGVFQGVADLGDGTPVRTIFDGGAYNLFAVERSP